MAGTQVSTKVTFDSLNNFVVLPTESCPITNPVPCRLPNGIYHKECLQQWFCNAPFELVCVM